MNNYQFTVCVALCDEDRARLDAILKALSAPKPAQEHESRATTQPEPEKAVEPTPEPQEEQKPEKEEPKNQKAPEVTLEQLQSLVVHLATSGKKDGARALVRAYAERVTEVPADKRSELFEKLKKLEA